MKLSRLDEELFVKDTRYACGFWTIHRSNFKSMLDNLITEESLIKFMKESKRFSLQANERMKVIPDDVNQKIKEFYEKLENACQLFSPIGEDEEAKAARTSALPPKDIFFMGIDAFFSVLSSGKDLPGTSFSSIFSSLEAHVALRPFLDSFMGSGYDRGDRLNETFGVFLPQMIWYYYRILLFYDGALQGQRVEDFFSSFKQKKDELLQEKNVSSAWNQSAPPNGVASLLQEEQQKEYWQQKKAESVHTLPPEGGKGEEEENLRFGTGKKRNNSRPPASFTPSRGGTGIINEVLSGDNEDKKNEISVIVKSETKLRQQFLSFWESNQSLFRSCWIDQLDSEWRQRICIRVRKTILTIAGGGYQSSVLYCPELDSSALSITDPHAEQDDTKTEKNHQSFLQLVDFLIESPHLPDLFAGETYLIDKDFIQYDPFLRKVYSQLKESPEQLKILTMICVSRRHVLLMFCFMVVAELTGRGIRFVSDQIPGSQGRSQPSTSFTTSNSTASSSDPASEDNSSVHCEKIFEIPSTAGFGRTDDTKEATSFCAGESTQTVPKRSAGRSCSSLSCFVKEEPDGAKFKVCSLCRKAGIVVPYCSSECQTNDWNAGHSDICGKHKITNI